MVLTAWGEHGQCVSRLEISRCFCCISTTTLRSCLLLVWRSSQIQQETGADQHVWNSTMRLTNMYFGNSEAKEFPPPQTTSSFLVPQIVISGHRRGCPIQTGRGQVCILALFLIWFFPHPFPKSKGVGNCIPSCPKELSIFYFMLLKHATVEEKGLSCMSEVFVLQTSINDVEAFCCGWLMGQKLPFYSPSTTGS